MQFKMTNLKWGAVLHEIISKDCISLAEKEKEENLLNSSMAEVADAFRRQWWRLTMSRATLTWINLYLELTGSPADESFESPGRPEPPGRGPERGVREGIWR